MKFSVDNENYGATVVEVHSVIDLPNRDFIVGIPAIGYVAITSKWKARDNDGNLIQEDQHLVKPGDKFIIFVAGTRLDTVYAHQNNLFRDGALNANVDAKGSLEKHRRIKAVKFAGNRSDALLMPLSSLSYIKGVDIDKLKVGDTFDTINGVRICEKYIAPVKADTSKKKNPGKSVSHVDAKLFPEHFDTANWFRNEDKFADNQEIIVTAKIHGTSFRAGHVKVSKDLTWYERFGKKLGFNIDDHIYDITGGSRRVIKYKNDQKGYYESDIWSRIANELADRIPKNYVLYGEAVGYIDHEPIMKRYTYGYGPGTYGLYLYRVVVVNEDGISVDLEWDQVKQFAINYGLQVVPELWRGLKKDFDANDWLDRIFAGSVSQYPNSLQLSDKKTVDEGICIRIPGKTNAEIYKAKSPKFLKMESEMLDEDISDIESEN